MPEEISVDMTMSEEPEHLKFDKIAAMNHSRYATMKQFELVGGS